MSAESSLPDILQEWQGRVLQAARHRQVLRLQGQGSRNWLGDLRQGDVLDTRAWSGIESYEPTELVITARCGTPVVELEAALAERGQHLAFEPPRHGPEGGTVGGMVAAGLSGPARPSRGALRDHVLGVRVINGRGQHLRFGGTVMKNVAGFDLSRLMAGSMGTLGLLTDVTLKVLPVPVAEATLRFECDQARGIDQINRWAAQPLPLEASAWWNGLLVVRLRGAAAAVGSAVDRLTRESGGEPVPADMAATFWSDLRDQRDEFFARARLLILGGQSPDAVLWRVSVPGTAPPLDLPGETLVEWFGAQRWLCTTAPAVRIAQVARQAGGHALAWVSRVPASVDLPPVLVKLHRQVQKSFDPEGVFDTGRLWPRAGD